MKEADEILKNLKAQKFHPVYVLTGDEPYYLDTIVQWAEEHILEPHEKDFNLTVMYGGDTEPTQIIDAAKRFPMMSERQVVIVKEAQQLKNIKELESYMENPTPSTLLFLVFRGGKVDRRLKWYTLAKKKGVTLTTKPLYDNQVPSWIKTYLSKKGYKITDKSALLMTEFIGPVLNKMVNELDKLMIALPKGHTISEDDIERHVGISKDFNSFELSDALFNRDKVKAFRIAQYFGENPKNHPIQLTIPSLYYSFSRLFMYQGLQDKTDSTATKTLGVHPFVLKSYKIGNRNYKVGKTAKVIGYLHEYDLKAKGMDNGSVTDGELLKELVFKILH